VRDGALEDSVWLSRVRRRDVRIWIAAARDSRSVMVVSARSLDARVSVLSQSLTLDTQD
jgi:hypothetical protein